MKAINLRFFADLVWHDVRRVVGGGWLIWTRWQDMVQIKQWYVLLHSGHRDGRLVGCGACSGLGHWPAQHDIALLTNSVQVPVQPYATQLHAD